MTIKETHENLVKEFDEMSDWEERYKHIIKLGRELPAFNEDYRTDKNKIEGCQSQVWMNAKLDNGKIVIEADSEAMIVKGLIAILIRAYSGFSPAEILSVPPDFLQKIGIDKHLSPTRKNGLGAMLKQIQMYALAFKAISK
jgi:cysteine desulfuration protein SufE